VSQSPCFEKSQRFRELFSKHFGRSAFLKDHVARELRIPLDETEALLSGLSGEPTPAPSQPAQHCAPFERNVGSLNSETPHPRSVEEQARR